MRPGDQGRAIDLRPKAQADGHAAATDDELARLAIAVLDANWMGHATRASADLYPHQWSWDSACIAIGYAGVDLSRAQAELRWLFASQWADGLLPHIRFADDGHYFPGPEFWQTHRSPSAPPEPKTSGIVQPPVHATAVWRVYRRARDGDEAKGFLRELLPGLVAWHAYLYRERTRDGDGLVEIWHPWESGMDNSPLWDDALARISPTRDAIPDYERVDLNFVAAAQRPTDAEYDRYAYLVKLYRDCGYDPERIRDECPFVVHDVLFNSLLVQANRDLAKIARILGEDPGPFEAWAERTAAGLEAKLWDDVEGSYEDYDVRAGERVRVQTAGAFSPLFAGIPTEDRARQLKKRLPASTVTVDGVGRVVTSVPPGNASFDPALYWRGPVWPMINWVVQAGLRRYGFTDEAEEIRHSLLELARREGFWEHYNAQTGRGQGTEQLSWTAALVLDLLDGERDQEGVDA
jgi:mannosylglycerate hydrolase